MGKGKLMRFLPQDETQASLPFVKMSDHRLLTQLESVKEDGTGVIVLEME